MAGIYHQNPCSRCLVYPGSGILATTTALPGGFAEATGAFIGCAILIVITGCIPMLGRLVASIPKPVASALLAGVLLNLCFAPALGLGTIPLMVAPILGAWLLGLYWHKLAAMPFAVAAFVLILFFFAESPAVNMPVNPQWLPSLQPQLPVFSLHAFVSVSIPLYLVTMAGQNIPGFTLLELNHYAIERSTLLKKTGLISVLIAMFGSIPVNMSAITAAMMCSDDAGADASKRYWAAATCGLVYIVLAFASGQIIQMAANAPPGLIVAVAGLALIPALVASLTTAFSNPQQIEAAALTFLITASGMTLLSISGAFWGIVVGVIAWGIKRVRSRF